MAGEYTYDSQAQFFPFFILTITALITLPLTYTLLRAPSDASSTGKKAPSIHSSYQPDDADVIESQRAKQKRKELRLKRMVTAGAGWLVMGWMVYLMMHMQVDDVDKPWNPFEILNLDQSLSDSAVANEAKRRYRRLGITMHPDKRPANVALNLTKQMVDDDWVEITKAYKALSDENSDVAQNIKLYGHPDGKQSTSFGIALPQFLVEEGSGKFVLLVYGALLGIGLPWLVGKWWYGSQKQTKERVLVTTAGNMFRECKEKMDEGDVVAAISSAMEFPEILNGAKADTGLGRLEKTLQAADGVDTGMLPKDSKKLSELEDPARRKALALMWAYLARLKLDDQTLDAEKYELAPTALRMNEAFLSIALAYGFTPPVLASFHLSQSLTQAIPPNPAARLPLLQLPHFTSTIVRSLESQSSSRGKKEHMSIQSFMSLPSEHRRTLASAAGLTSSHLQTAENVARQLPVLKVEKAFFKVQGEKFIIPSSLVQFVIKARVIPPGTPSSSIPTINEDDLKDIDPADGDIEAQKKEPEQHPVPLAHAPYLPRDRSPRWHVFLADQRQAKVAVPPFTFSHFDKLGFKEGAGGLLEPTFEVMTLKMQFQAPPQPGEYKFQMHLVCDSYVGFDHKEEAIMMVEDSSKALEVDDDDDISEPEEDSIAGAMATLKGQATATDAANKEAKAARQARRAEQRMKLQDDESDYESGTDEDEDSESETDTDTSDSDGE